MVTIAQAYQPSPSSPAPWAEVVPGYGPVTVDLLLTLPDDGYIYEVVDGVLVRFAPDLAVEIASPSQTANEMAAKARVYLRAGTRLVWVVAIPCVRPCWSASPSARPACTMTSAPSS